MGGLAEEARIPLSPPRGKAKRMGKFCPVAFDLAEGTNSTSIATHVLPHDLVVLEGTAICPCHWKHSLAQ